LSFFLGLRCFDYKKAAVNYNLKSECKNLRKKRLKTAKLFLNYILEQIKKWAKILAPMCSRLNEE